MKKIKLLLVVVFALLLTGCSIYQINKLTYDQVIDLTVYDKSPESNTSMQGVKFYLPRDMRIEVSGDNNAILYSDGDKYYLYIDVISYYNKATNEYDLELSGDRIYTKEIEYQEKKGYIIITEQEENYFLEIMHNYGKIELITTKDKIKVSLAKALTILSSVTYNDKVIASLIGENSLDYDEETYNLLSPDERKANVLDYAQEYVDTEDEIPDEDIINW